MMMSDVDDAGAEYCDRQRDYAGQDVIQVTSSTAVHRHPRLDR